MKLVGFDIETWKITPDEATDIKAFRPLGISCVGFRSDQGTGTYFPEDIKTSDRAMNQHELMSVADELWRYVHEGYQIVTWNGLQFDFDILNEEADCLLQNIPRLAMDHHIDMMFQVVCSLGYPLGLDTAAKGMGLPGKMEGMHGDLAPVMWRRGFAERQKVVEYVGKDAIATLELANVILEKQYLRWISKSGRVQVKPMAELLTVKKCLELPMPDTSWMSNPLKRESFTEWMKETKHE